ncbi:MAG TPA: peptidylprolyl isomerase, partial [Firmicutes bacterium]|nr:peptidylprolyl isomerase [Bacillota bacterium]
MVGDSPHLDGGYAAFGRVSSGMEHAQAIAAAKRGPGDRPVQDQRIKKITMELFGQTYPEPEKVK